MNYKIKYTVTNCDGKIDHPQAKDFSWQESVQCDGCSTAAEAQTKANEIIAKRYPDCTAECVECEENPIVPTGMPTNVFDPVDLKKKDNTQKARNIKPSSGKGYE